ncbi:hypothetical protein TRFO_19367 [Tritrichomonas foetus]|uniref:Uncharacterized protein n=1 Tax=Tritrichomonas foetus TaxID=1144522 RepID=A0A1J4KN97_9EUKA|nr:hypothetical protein TRFO_19367 [Tritrichomonas foetus]|eukprot:OHT11268.1 hypothetical protein TRFO_19367 [Tritrichomonas foetus]
MDKTFLTRAKTASGIRLNEKPLGNPSQCRVSKCVFTAFGKRKKNNIHFSVYSLNLKNQSNICGSNVSRMKENKNKDFFPSSRKPPPKNIWQPISFNQKDLNTQVPESLPSPSAFYPTDRARPKLLPENLDLVFGHSDFSPSCRKYMNGKPNNTRK